MPVRTGILIFAMACLASSAVFSADATIPRGVVELFTSQGCASCPPADEAFQTLARTDDVVALSYHVDYWNYLGWNDTLASKENTQRQYGYARTFRRTGVYTPQAVINGRDHVNGADLPGIHSVMTSMKAEGKGLDVPVSAAIRDDEIEIEIGQGKGKADVLIAYFTRQQPVDVLKGENTGRRIVYWNSVYDVQTVGMWNGDKARFTIPAKSFGKTRKEGCAILLQTTGAEGEPSAILGAIVLMAGSKTP